MRGVSAGVASLFLLAVAAGPASADAEKVPGEVLVRFEPGADHAAVRAAHGLRLKAPLRVRGWERVTIRPGLSVAEAVRKLRGAPGVRFAEPNYRYRAFADGRQWGLHNDGSRIFGITGRADADVDAPEAWQITQGSRSVLVAVADTGIRAAHPDLAPNVVGASDATWDPNGHGTHVATILGAAGQELTGVSPVVSMLPVRVLGADGSGTAEGIANGFRDAAEAGARIVNASFGGQGSRAVYDAVAAAPEVLFVAAAGNGGHDLSLSPNYPCALDLPNVICVGASDQHDRLAWFSDHGNVHVDLAAPGADILGHYAERRQILFDDFEGAGAAARWTTDGELDGWQVVPSGPGHALAAGGPGGEGPDRRAVAASSFDLTGLSGCSVTLNARLDTGRAGHALHVEVARQPVGSEFYSDYALHGRYRRNLRVWLPETGWRHLALRYKRSPGPGGDRAEVDDLALECDEPGSTGTAPIALHGTSMASPMVSGAAALLLAQDPSRTPAQLKERLMASVDRMESMAHGTVSDGRLNVHRALAGGVTPPLPQADHPQIETVAANMTSPADVAAHPDGGFVVVDAWTHTVHRVSATGVRTVIAGTGVAGFSGDGGPAANAQLDNPNSVDVMPDGGILVTDYFNDRVRRIGPDGVISTVAGGGSSLLAEGAPATSVALARPSGISVIPAGGYYLAEYDGRLSRVDAGGSIRTVTDRYTTGEVVGGRKVEATVDGGFVAMVYRIALGRGDGSTAEDMIDPNRSPCLQIWSASDPELNREGDGEPADCGTYSDFATMLPTPDGGLLLSEHGHASRIRRIAPDGTLWTLAGGGGAYDGDGGRARHAHLRRPAGMDLTPEGAVLVTDSGNGAVRRITSYRTYEELHAAAPPDDPGEPAQPRPDPLPSPDPTPAPASPPGDLVPFPPHPAPLRATRDALHVHLPNRITLRGARRAGLRVRLRRVGPPARVVVRAFQRGRTIGTAVRRIGRDGRMTVVIRSKRRLRTGRVRVVVTSGGVRTVRIVRVRR